MSSDALRALVGEGEHDLRASTDAFAVLDDVVERRLRRGLTTVIDSLGTDPQRRADWRELAERHRVPCIAIAFDVPAAQVRQQNKMRDKRVPDAVLRRQITEWPAVLADVRAEPFAAVHVADVGEVAALVTPTMLRGATDSTVVIRPRLIQARLAPLSRAPSPLASSVSFGLQIPQFTWPGGSPEMGERLRAIARSADELGVDSLWVMDHFRQIPQMGPAWSDMLESWTTLGHLAACTTRATLGTLVSGITYRNVAHLAKIAATLDVLSGGRVVCGIGLAWFEDEHRAYGWRFGSRAERYALLEDALQLLPKMWGPGGKPFDGRVLTVPTRRATRARCSRSCRSWWAAPVSSAPCASSLDTPMPATCSVIRQPCGARSTCSTVTARRSDAIRRRSRSPTSRRCSSDAM